MPSKPVSQSDQTGLLLKQAVGDMRAFARLLTSIEQKGVESLRHPELLKPSGRAFRLGITGPPGAGKSTLVGQLLGRFSNQGLKVGVLAVDPSSPFTKGAILGDRIRYSEHFLDPRIFIRSLGTRGSLGGLSGSAYLMLRAFDACGFDIVLVETVGVGQTELDVLHVADLICVLLVPESGDSIQAMKAGLMEIADIFVVNKADRPGAQSLVRELEAAQTASESKAAEIYSTVATNGEGIETLYEAILRQRPAMVSADSRDLREEAKALLRVEFETNLDERVQGVQTSEQMAALLLSKAK